MASGAGLAARPTISIIVACVNAPPALSECLAALGRQRGEHDAEVILVDARPDGEVERAAASLTNVRVVRLDAPCGIPEHWRAGIARASGDVVVVTEDHCIPREDWYDEIARARETGFDVAGGAVENACRDRAVDWAVFLSDYAHAMPPIPRGDVSAVTGNNTAYRRELFDPMPSALASGRWEYFLHAELRARGARFVSVPGMVVDHKKRFGLGYALSQRFHYSRSFAAMRAEDFAAGRRALYALGSPLLPAQLVARTAACVLRKRRHRRELVAALPALCLLGLAHGAGELTGYLLGPGDSLRRVQ